ncbi:putative UDP-glucosyltransferase [Corchorus olitorius]|uniref:UDP-glucosyltransferase n=1 Tax=Corchorus olitorius TaxID=93759 RepID=A0A1R3IN65_9ROSI|nr:putative UDP-glucosyltransferase [Corchorus olitorius]
MAKVLAHHGQQVTIVMTPLNELAPEYFPFFTAANLMEEAVMKLFEKLTPLPNCIISDRLLHYTTKIATKFQVPSISFRGSCCLWPLCLHNIHSSRILDSITSSSEYFIVPGLPVKLEFTKVQHVLHYASKIASKFQVEGVYVVHTKKREATISMEQNPSNLKPQTSCQVYWYNEGWKSKQAIDQLLDEEQSKGNREGEMAKGAQLKSSVNPVNKLIT